jgi:regulator of sirC expression with transglutaminase-like and TPR domain
MTLAEAPLHLFVKYTDDDGRIWNLEASSGAGFTRDLWYRAKLPMTDEAVENGVYLRALSREETMATMAAFLVEHHISVGDYEKAIAVADVLLKHYPNSAYLLAKKGTAYYRLLQSEVIGKYSRMEDIPPSIRAKADHWYAENQKIFEHLDALGWRATDGQLQ